MSARVHGVDDGLPAPPQLLVAYECRDGQMFRRQLQPGQEMRVGREHTSDLRIADSNVSRLHVLLRCSVGTWLICNESKKRTVSVRQDERWHELPAHVPGVGGRRRLPLTGRAVAHLHGVPGAHEIHLDLVGVAEEAANAIQVEQGGNKTTNPFPEMTDPRREAFAAMMGTYFADEPQHVPRSYLETAQVLGHGNERGRKNVEHRVERYRRSLDAGFKHWTELVGRSGTGRGDQRKPLCDLLWSCGEITALDVAWLKERLAAAGVDLSREPSDSR